MTVYEHNSSLIDKCIREKKAAWFSGDIYMFLFWWKTEMEWKKRRGSLTVEQAAKEKA